MITFKSLEIIKWLGFNELWFIYPLIFVLCYAFAIKKFIDQNSFDGVLLSVIASIAFVVMYGTLLYIAMLAKYF